jgi:competence protein ComEA
VAEPRLPTAPGEPTPDPQFWGAPRGRTRRPASFDTPLDRLRDSWESFRGQGHGGLVLLAIAALVAGFVWYQAGAGGGEETPAPASIPTTSPGAAPGNSVTETIPSTTASEARSARIVVHVAGAVTEPGVVELPAGARVIDALDAAGGGLPEADLDRLNLAAKVADGQRVIVQRAGDPPAPADAGGGGAPLDGPTEGGLVNLNTATTTQLEELPGIGPVLAGAIVDERERRGGFRSVNELRDVRGIGDKRFADLQPRVTV